jgi:ketosteroid isomerase-like protein
MSQENLETFEHAIDALNRGDVEQLLESVDPAAEWHMALQVLLGGGAGVYRGHDGVREFMDDMDEAFSEYRVEYPEIRDLGDRILALGRLWARGRESGAETETPVSSVTWIRDGKSTRVLSYLNHAEALEAAGLSE